VPRIPLTGPWALTRNRSIVPETSSWRTVTGITPREIVRIWTIARPMTQIGASIEHFVRDCTFVSVFGAALTPSVGASWAGWRESTVGRDRSQSLRSSLGLVYQQLMSASARDAGKARPFSQGVQEPSGSNTRARHRSRSEWP